MRWWIPEICLRGMFRGPLSALLRERWLCGAQDNTASKQRAAEVKRVRSTLQSFCCASISSRTTQWEISIALKGLTSISGDEWLNTFPAALWKTWSKRVLEKFKGSMKEQPQRSIEIKINSFDSNFRIVKCISVLLPLRVFKRCNLRQMQLRPKKLLGY